jgi:signal transduction histidine kinase
MKLQEKAVISIAVIFISLFLILAGIARVIVLEGFKRIEQDNVKQSVETIWRLIEEDIDNLELINTDYASWDQTYAFMKSRDKEYLESEFPDTTFYNTKINFLGIIDIDTSYTPVFLKSFDSVENRDVPLPEELKAQISSKSRLIAEIDDDKGVSGIIMIDNSPMLISSRPVLDSNGSGPVGGIMIMGRYLDEAEIDRLNEITDLEFSLELFNDENINKTKLFEWDNPEESLIDDSNGHLITGYKIVKDIDGNSPLFIKLEMDRKILKQGILSIRYLLLSLLIIGIPFAFGAKILLQKFVLTRVVKLNTTVTDIGNSGDFSKRAEVLGSDELGSLSSSVNGMLETLEQSMNELKEQERLMRDSNDKLMELDELKTNFLSTVSHELRTPLTSILGFAKIIKRKMNKVIMPALNIDFNAANLAEVMNTDEKVAKAVFQTIENVDIIISEGERLTAMINDVLDVTKMEAGKVDWKSDSIWIEDVIERAFTATSSIFLEKGLGFLKLIKGEIPLISGDSDKLLQVMINLFSNAVKFTEKGSITCKVSKFDGEIIVSVIDTGIGIDKKEQNSIFEKFRQVGDTLINKPKGTGLGLSICKSIIEHHRGRMWVESELNKGSNFSFTLPI